MNYKFLVVEELEKFSRRFPKYTIGQIMYSMLSVTTTSKEFKRSDLLYLDDKVLYTSLRKAMKEEDEN